MGRDRSLDEFLGDEESAAPESEGRDSADSESGTDADGTETGAGPTPGDSDPEGGSEPTPGDSDPEGGSEPTPGDGAGTSATADGAADASTATDGDRSAPDGVEPAAVTYRWEPDGARCAECGTTVDRLWSDESGQVCGECKEW